ncbi:MAG: rod shape-determining protein MreC, partial [Verrucomicrobiota bacterium]
LDPLCRLSVRLTDGDSVAILEGRYTVRAGKSLCRLNYLSPDTDFQEGMEVTTSGLSRVIPGGLKIGMLKPWDEEQDFNTESPVYKQALMQPAARFGSFRFVRIVYKADARDEIELE